MSIDKDTNEISPPPLVEPKSDRVPEKVKKGPTLSPRERDLYYLLKVDQPQSTAELTQKFYEEEDIPFNARKILISRLRSIAAKLDFVNHQYKICKSDRTGPHFIKFWLEKRDGGTATYI